MSEQKEVKNQEIKEYGQMELADNRQQHKLHLLSIIGEVEGHECLSANTKTTKYEHVPVSYTHLISLPKRFWNRL